MLEVGQFCFGKDICRTFFNIVGPRNWWCEIAQNKQERNRYAEDFAQWMCEQLLGILGKIGDMVTTRMTWMRLRIVWWPKRMTLLFMSVPKSSLMMELMKKPMRPVLCIRERYFFIEIVLELSLTHEIGQAQIKRFKTFKDDENFKNELVTKDDVFHPGEINPFSSSEQQQEKKKKAACPPGPQWQKLELAKWCIENDMNCHDDESKTIQKVETFKSWRIGWMWTISTSGTQQQPVLTPIFQLGNIETPS